MSDNTRATKADKLDGEHFDVVVIGAGMSGLAAGIRLAYFGKKTLVIERHYAIGGLNGFYVKNKRKYDVGLHAMTNFVPEGTKNSPLSKILRQLRIRREELDLCPQICSEIHAFGNKIRFDNDFVLLESEIEKAFPQQIDGFKKLDEFLRDFNETALDSADVSAREHVAKFISDPLLIDTLFIPLSFYGNSRQRDMSLPLFAIMWRSIFREGLARPHAGVRQIANLLRKKLQEAGAVLRLNCGVKKILTTNGTATGVELDNGARIVADKIISSAGLVETMRLCENVACDYGAENVGRITFCETITQFAAEPATDFGWGQTIVFFNDAERFNYAEPAGLIDPRSGAICIPNNYRWQQRELAPQEGCLRVTCLANHALWKAARGNDEEYARAKSLAYEKMLDTALTHLSPVSDNKLRSAIVATDMFTPATIERFTGKLGGAIYGSPEKIRTGTLPVKNLFICGTDQGFHGITGAMLSGISMANLHLLP